MSDQGAAGRHVPPWSMAVAAMICIQLSSALSVFVIEHLGAAGTTWLRMCFGAVFVVIIVRPSLRSIRRADVSILLALGTVTGCMTTMLLSAAERIPLGTAVAIEFLGPLTVAALTSRRSRSLIWPALALVGVVLLTEPWNGSIDPLGVGFALIAGVCWGLYNLLTQRVGDRFSGITGLAITIPIAAVVTSVFGAPQVIGGELDWWMLGALAGIALLTPVVAFGLEMLALKRLTQTAFGTLLSIEPAFGVLIGLIVLSQLPTPLQLLGVAVVIVAGAAAQRGGGRSSAAPSGHPETGPITAIGDGVRRDQDSTSHPERTEHAMPRQQSVDIRHATIADAGTVAQLLHDFNSEFQTPTPSADEFATRFRVLLGRDDVLVLLAQHGNTPAIGFALLTLRPTPYGDGPLAQLEELYVRPALRDAGIGSALLRAAIDDVVRRGAIELHINVDEIDTDTRRFYERHGFVNIQPGEDYRMLCYLRELSSGTRPQVA
ncbi:hypothetical protein GCM10011490_10890 [Pseudoclavibacter endophyticus]|nr:hypothetical protein GCM10011490_10890 [Pseudoclavibacter endophyticus]